MYLSAFLLLFFKFLFISLTDFDHCRLDCMLPGHCLVYFHTTILKHAVVYLSRTVACTVYKYYNSIYNIYQDSKLLAALSPVGL